LDVGDQNSQSTQCDGVLGVEKADVDPIFLGYVFSDIFIVSAQNQQHCDDLAVQYANLKNYSFFYWKLMGAFSKKGWSEKMKHYLKNSIFRKMLFSKKNKNFVK